MKVYQSILKDCACLGVNPPKQRQLNRRNCFAFSMYILTTVLNVYNFSYMTQSFEQYLTSIYVTSSIAICFLQFINLFWQMPHLIEFISSVDKIVQERKCKCQHKKIGIRKE